MECTNITTIEELSVFCRWVEDREPVEHLFKILPLKQRNIQISKLVSMGFDGAATLEFIFPPLESVDY